MWNTTLPTLFVSTIIAAVVTLSGCDRTKTDDAQSPDASTQSSEQTAANPPVNNPSASDADLDGATVQQGTPVKYNVASWGQDKASSLKIDALDDIKATFGKVMSTDENSLDYASNPAVKYRFMKTDAPYLDIIDSEKYLELGWYYANPTDSDKEKEHSKSHAKKAHKLARQLMGEEGGKMVEDMLSGQIIKNKVVGGQKVELAKCEFYSCMLVINKSVPTAENS